MRTGPPRSVYASILGSGFRALRGSGEPSLQAQDRLRVELRDPRLGDAEHLADLAERELLVVVERDDELLALREPGDRLAERFLQLGGVKRALRCGSVRVLDRVDQGDLVTARAADRPELVEGGDRGARDVREAVLELLDGDADLLGDLLVGGR